MLVTVEIDPARRTAAFREVSSLAAGDSCRVVLDGVRGADFPTLSLSLYRDAAAESPVAACGAFSAVPGHPSLADGELALDTLEMAAWFEDAVPEESDSDSDSAPASRNEPRLAARASLAERSVRAEGWLVAADADRVWAACRVPVLLRPGAGSSGASPDPSSVRALVSALVEGLVSAALSGKAGKAPPSAAGNLASLDADGDLADSGATPESIKAAAVAEVVANAPGTMDTLKEIADILGSSQQAGTVLKRILDLESGKVTVDDSLSTPGAAADAKAVGDAFSRGFTEWAVVPSVGPTGLPVELVYEFDEAGKWSLCEREDVGGGDPVYWPFAGPKGDRDSTRLVWEASDLLVDMDAGFEASRVRVAPTKTSQLTNDGAPNGGGTPYATTAQVAAKQDVLSAQQLANIAAVPGKANSTDLPYRLVEPGKWEFSDGLNRQLTGPIFDGEEVWYYYTNDNLTSQDFGTEAEASAALSLSFGDSLTATRPSLPGHLCDRAGNRVVVTGDTTLTLPAAITGYARDFLVRLEISGSTVPTITFQGQGSEAPNGADEITYETDGDEFPVPDEAGTWDYSFTENCVSHKFAVALKKVNVVAQ